MASYEELYALHSDNDGLLHKVEVATWIAADTVRQESDTTPNHVARLVWAAKVLEDGRATQQMLNAILAQNNTATVAQIQNSTDAEIQAAVDAAVDLVSAVEAVIP